MNKESYEATSRLIEVILNELAMPPEITASIRRIADRVLAECAKIDAATTSPPVGPTITEELRAEGQRATVNIGGVALMVMQAGVPPSLVRDLIRGHMLQSIAHEQRLIHTLLALPSRGQAGGGDLH